MEDKDLEKYIFDVSNKEAFRKFRAFRLLKRILKTNDYLSLVDMDYFSSLYEKSIFDKKVIIQEFWDDIPDNFDELPWREVKKIFIKSLSQKEYDEWEQGRIRQFSREFLNLKTPFISFRKKDNDYNINSSLSQDDFDRLYERIYNIKLYGKLNIHSNAFFFLSKRHYPIIQNFKFEKVSVMFTTLKDYKSEKPILPKNVHPILLKKYEDTHTLFKLLKNNEVKPVYKNIIKIVPTYFNNIFIKNYFQIKNIALSKLSNKKEIYFLGENGDGKTILLQAILLALKGNQNEGLVTDFIKPNFYKKKDEKLSLKAESSEDKGYEFKENPSTQKSKFDNIFAYGVSRFRFSDAVNNTEKNKEDATDYLSLFNANQYLENPIKWLKHLQYKELAGEKTAISLNKAKELLIDILEKDINIEVSPDKVTFTEKETEVHFDQLSDGYKSVIIWVCDLLARFSRKQPQANSNEDFSGIVLVDEIGMLLHPNWQYKIIKKLRDWFPKVQFIFTTHSPMVIMGASKDAVFYKVYKEDGETKISEPYYNKDMNHLMANGIITSPLFDMETARTISFDEETQELDTSKDLLHNRIHAKISEQLKEMKKTRKSPFTIDEIDDLIKQALVAEPNPDYNTNDKD